MKLIITLTFALLLSGCTAFGNYAGNLGKALVGIGQVSQVPEVRQSLIDYLSAEELASVNDSLSFLDKVYTTVVEMDKSTSVVDLVLESPEAWRRIPIEYQAIKAAVQAHAASSGEAVPTAIVLFDNGVTPAYSDIAKAVESSDKLRRVGEVISLLKPLAIILL